MIIAQKLAAAVRKNNSLVCVGLDPDISKIPHHLTKAHADILFRFNREIIDATADVVCAFKPNSAFYEAFGSDGVYQLRLSIEYIRQTYPDVVIILDAKRADIGSTNAGYVTYAFDYLKADAITLHPYLGREALQPFLDREDKACVILCRTSNPGAAELQDLDVHGEPLYRTVARKIASDWNTHGNCMIVAGATYPHELAEIRASVGGMDILVPGIGAQGGDIAQVVKAGRTASGTGLIVSASRSILYASAGEDFALKGRIEAERMRSEINKYRVE